MTDLTPEEREAMEESRKPIETDRCAIYGWQRTKTWSFVA